jgi:hypothetical protein
MLCPSLSFSDDDVEEEKEELSNELVVTLKQKITTLEEQVTELHLAVHDHEQVEVLRQGYRRPIALQRSISIR